MCRGVGRGEAGEVSEDGEGGEKGEEEVEVGVGDEAEGRRWERV